MDIASPSPIVQLAFPKREDEQLKVLHCDRCGIDGNDGQGVRRYQGIPYCVRCASKMGLV